MRRATESAIEGATKSLPRKSLKPAEDRRYAISAADELKIGGLAGGADRVPKRLRFGLSDLRDRRLRGHKYEER
jgi:hypothetical protein